MAALILTVFAVALAAFGIVAIRQSFHRKANTSFSFQEDWPVAIRSLVILFFTLLITIFAHPGGFTAFLWVLVVVVICVVSVLMAVMWPTTRIGDFMEDRLWGKTSSRPAPGLLVQLGGFAVLLVLWLLVSLFGESDSSSSREVANPPQTTAPSVTAEPATASPSPTQAPASASPEPTPSETTASPTPTPSAATKSPAPKPSPTTIQSDCGDVELFKNDTTQEPDFSPGDVQVCVGGVWVEWGDTSPAKIRYNHSNKVGEYYYFLIEREEGRLLIRTTTARS